MDEANCQADQIEEKKDEIYETSPDVTSGISLTPARLANSSSSHNPEPIKYIV